MSDLKKAHLAVDKLEAMVAQTGFDTSWINNQVNISDQPGDPSFGHANNLFFVNDFIVTNEAGDVYGGEGDDIFVGGAAANTFHGGNGLRYGGLCQRRVRYRAAYGRDCGEQRGGQFRRC